LEILHRDQTEIRHQPAADLVSVVLAKVSNPLVQSSQQQTSVLAAPRPLDSARNPPLRRPQLAECSPVRVGTRYELASRKRGKAPDP
jgi:hypothetical protein